MFDLKYMCKKFVLLKSEFDQSKLMIKVYGWSKYTKKRWKEFVRFLIA